MPDEQDHKQQEVENFLGISSASSSSAPSKETLNRENRGRENRADAPADKEEPAFGRDRPFDRELPLNRELLSAREDTVSKALVWLAENRRRVLYGAIGVIVLIVIAVFLSNNVFSTGGSGLEPQQALPQASEVFQSDNAAVNQELKAHIVGAVHAPGVYVFQPGERVVDLIEKAGGSLEGAQPDVLSLASKLSDGQKICVPFGDAGAPTGVAGVANTGTNTGGCELHQIPTTGQTININLAGAEELENLAGIGQARARAIVEYRETNGAFESVDELANISGISSSVIDGFRDQVAVN